MMSHFGKYLSDDIIKANYKYKFPTRFSSCSMKLTPVIPNKDMLNIVVGLRS